MFTLNLGDLTGLVNGPGPGPGSGNFDADGFSDTEEWVNGTNPLTFPQSGATLRLGLDARDIVQADSTGVSNWTSVGSSGVGSASQATANWQPLFRNASVPLGGRPGVQFDSQLDADAVAEADGMLTTATGVGADYSILSLYAFRNDVGFARVVQGGNGTRHAAGAAGANNWLIGPYGGPGQAGTHRLFDGAFIDSGNGTTLPVISTALGSSTAAEQFFLNGGLVGSNNGTTTPGTVGLGAEGAFAEAAKSDIGLVLVFDTTLTNDERIGVEYYMAQAYGLAGFNATTGQRSAGAAQLNGFLVPEPGSMSLLLLGGMACLLRRRR